MSTEHPTLNRVGMPPAGRTIQRRRAELEAEAAERGDAPANLGNPLIVSIISCVAVLAAGALVTWIVAWLVH
jgi:hypothetical protein